MALVFLNPREIDVAEYAIGKGFGAEYAGQVPNREVTCDDLLVGLAASHLIEPRAGGWVSSLDHVAVIIESHAVTPGEDSVLSQVEMVLELDFDLSVLGFGST